jgi:hypothetical protein
VGVFYLKRDVPIVEGHLILCDSPWALTGVSQAQFWNQSLSRFGDGRVGGVLSIDISDWTSKGSHGKPAAESTALEIATEVWHQLRQHFPKELRDDDLIAPLDAQDSPWFLDPDIDADADALLTGFPTVVMDTTAAVPTAVIESRAATTISASAPTG